MAFERSVKVVDSHWYTVNPTTYSLWPNGTAKIFCIIHAPFFSIAGESLLKSRSAFASGIQACSADLTSLMGSFTYLASSISAMTLNCPAGLTLKATHRYSTETLVDFISTGL